MGNLSQKIAGTDPRLLFAALLVLVIVPFIFPLGLPVVVHEPVRDLYMAVEKLPAGSVIAYEVQAEIGQWGEVRPGSIAVLNHLLTRDVKIVFCTFTEDGPMIISTIIRKADQALLAKKTYGQDYVVFGYVPGSETAIGAFIADIHKTVPKDIYGTSTETIPMMKNIRSSKDLAAVIVVETRGDWVDIIVRQWGTSANVPILLVDTAGDYLMIVPYVPKYVKAMAISTPGGAEYEKLTGRPAEATSWLDSLGMAYLIGIVTMVIGNITYFAMRAEQKKKEVQK